MTTRPPAALRQTDVFLLAPPGMLEAARDYMQMGAVLRPRRRGHRLAAEVRGTDDTYACTVELEADDGAPAAGPPALSPRCACPSQRRFCKHVLALLLLWSTEPAAFQDLDRALAALGSRPSADLADLLCELALGSGDLSGHLDEVAAAPDWAALPPGRCLEAWDRFRDDGRAAGRWPEAALILGARIAGPPGAPMHRQGPDAALDMRQLAWWLVLVAPDLPEAALQPWVAHLGDGLEAARRSAAPGALPPELGVWLARLAAALPDGLAAQRRFLARFASAVPTLRAVVEAQLYLLLWSEELQARLAVAPAVPHAVAARCRDVLATLEAPASGP